MNSALKTGSEYEFSNICCCCLKSDCFKDISSEYEFSGHKEVYGDMLNETFHLQVPKHFPEDYIVQLICDQCIVQLREAYAFRSRMLDSQAVILQRWDQFQSRRSEATTQETDSTLVTEIKLEVEPEAGCDDGETGADIYQEVDEILQNIKMELVENSEKVTRKRKGNGRRAKQKKCKIEDESEDITPDPQKDWSKIVERRGVGPVLRENSLKLLANSTICVFQWNKSWYRCFCCQVAFPELDSLREHTSSEHTLEDIEKKIIHQQNRLVKVEVSIINCKICSKKIENLTELRDHLHEEHKIEFVHKEDLLVPFKISSQLQCQICSENFTVFRLLNIHMNKHYQKQVCHICGSGFSNLVFLNLHKSRAHRLFHCKECDMIFNNKSDKKTHDITVHDVKFERKLRFPCPYCPQRFFQENFRVEHLVEKHGMTRPEHKCVVCSKVFITRSLCNNHMKNVHKKEKNHECDICHNLFYTKSDVLRHRVTHTGEKKFSCSICNSPFATKCSLRRHVKRTHVGMQ